MWAACADFGEITEAQKSFLGAFAELRKAILSFIMSVRLSVRMEQLRSHWADFHGIWYLSIFRKSVEKSQVSLKYENNSTLHEDRCTFMVISCWILLRMRNVSDKFVQKIKTHFVFNNFFFENRVVYEVMWKYIVERERPRLTIIRRMHIERWITKATDTNSKYVILIAFPLQQWLDERTSMLRFTYFACLVQQ